MKIGNVTDSLNQAVASAIEKDLPDVKKSSGDLFTPTAERPVEGDLQVYHFPQDWGSSALGFDGGLAMQALSWAYTTVVVNVCAGQYASACVYFNGRLAYMINQVTTPFLDRIESMQIPDVRTAVRDFGAVKPALPTLPAPSVCQPDPLVELARKIKTVRDLQRDYFASRDKGVLGQSKQAEKELDALVKQILILADASLL